MALGTTTALADIANLQAQGKGVELFMVGGSSGGITAGNSTSGFITAAFIYNTIGTSTQSTPIQDGLTSNPLRMANIQFTGSRSVGAFLVRAYRIGTVNLATGVFTHDAATFPITKTQMGTSQALDLIPMMEITTATATTAPAYTFTYTNQANASVTGTVTNTLPAAITAARSVFLMRLNTGDNAVNDISAMSFSATGTAGAATIWGVELLTYCTGSISVTAAARNTILKGMTIPDINPGTATSGTTTSQLVPMFVAQSLSTSVNMQITAFWDA